MIRLERSRDVLEAIVLWWNVREKQSDWIVEISEI
jgi:hypothetical protein